MSVTLAAEQPFHGVGRQMGKLMDRYQKGYYNFSPGELWTPNVNLYETDGSYLVCIDLAGVDKDKIDVTVEQHILRLQGRRAVPSPTDSTEGAPPPGRVRVHLMEIDHGSFSREVELPLDVLQDKIHARYRNGLLWIELPKK